MPQGWAQEVRVLIADGAFSRIDVGVPPEAGDERYSIGVPGMPNLHCHAFQRGMAGLSETRGPSSDSFWTWREVMYRFLEALTPEDVEAIAALAYCEMLETGFTRVGEFHYLHHGPDGQPYDNIAEMAERIAAAANLTGIGLTLLPSLYVHGGFGGQNPDPGQRRFINSVDQFAKLHEASRAATESVEGSVVGIAPHSLRAVTPDELFAAIEIGGASPIHIHVAEQIKEVAACLAWSERRPVQWLLENMPVDTRWCFIHATHMTPDETAKLSYSGAVAGLCPLTEASLGDGTFNGATFAGAGGLYGVGSDSNILIGAADELRQLEYSQRLQYRQRNVMTTQEGASTGETLYRSALEGGARALGAASAIVVGNEANVVTLDVEHPSLIGRPAEQILDSWIFAAGSGGRANAVQDVWSRGQKVVANGRHIARDAIARRYGEAMRRVLSA
ncbi:formimidoylglutamate deiminase [Variibacter gotjawalensis]|uniref:formimidoylglutamate deiminase n=1 Tax=Variibacter gotjawalensis TaxID=1333996 RepID=UPI001D833713|nr:formimidoylglutamate deiminase [Variibacter gotjawalensis]NIK49158.1 formiminoglutamate deiminase [Variibacter gotjawalensis]